jgi:hypothetical protein
MKNGFSPKVACCGKRSHKTSAAIPKVSIRRSAYTFKRL